MGQALLPEHFYAQEQALRDEMDIRSRMRRAPAWGLASLRWDEYQLRRGVVSVQELTAVLPSGILVDVPGNSAPAMINLAAIGATRTPLYLHLSSGFDLADDVGAEADGAVERVVQRLELSPNPYSATSAECMKLAELECAPDGQWTLVPSYVPPLVQVGAEPFTAPIVERMRAVALALGQLLATEIEENHLVSESQVAAKACLRGLLSFQALLADLAGEIRPHPYELFDALRALHFDVCVFRGIHPGEVGGYAHEDLGASLGRLLAELERQVQPGRQRLPYVEFQRKAGLLACPLGKDVRRARDVYLLVQKPQVSSKLDLARVKLASESRIHLVHERALRGIPFERLESPPFRHGLSSNVEFYAIAPGQEWDYAVAESRVVLFESPALEGCRVYLYWRQE